MRLTIQLCTYKRPQLLARVLEACFDQTVSPDSYEVVLVNDGSPDDTPAVIERLRPAARCAFTVVHQANAGLAKARNAGLARATGERVAFIDDDVLPTPVFAAEHLHSDQRHGDVIVRGAVINTSSFDRLPPPVWSIVNYSGNYFWTSNVSVRRARLDRVGGRFDESFAEYGWEDIELGMRLRARGVRGIFNRFAVAFHYKPRPTAGNVDGMLRQARSQARTAVQLRALHEHWRVRLATGDDPVRRAFHRAVRRLGVPERLAATLGSPDGGRVLGAREAAAARALARETYYDELDRAHGAPG